MKLNEFDFRHPSTLAERRLGQGEGDLGIAELRTQRRTRIERFL
jgi:hypothetical protein